MYKDKGNTNINAITNFLHFLSLTHTALLDIDYLMYKYSFLP